MNPNAQRLIDGKRAHLLPCLYHFYADPPVLVRGEMQYLFDDRGRRYTDFYAGVTVMNAGHCNPAIIGPALDQAKVLQHTTSIYLTEPMVELGRKLAAFLGHDLSHAFFVNSGTEANEGALLLARLHTKRRGFLALRGGLHGRSHLTMSVTGIDLWRTDPFPNPDVRLAPRPHCAACELGKTFDSCGFACLQAVERLLSENEDVAAFITEPIQGNGGIVAPPPGYLKELKALLARHGVLLILDEIQTGFGRTGSPFRFQAEDVAPDIICVAKALGNGFPIGAFCTNSRVAASYTRPGASTLGGNPVSATAALQVLDYHLTHRLAERSATLGRRLRQHLALSLARHPAECSELRGDGLMLGLELRRNGVALARETDVVLEAMKDAGFLIGKTGLERNVLSFMPPLVIGEADIDACADALEHVLTTCLAPAPPATGARP
jgi:alanine-glyoxylate transaminase/(R)-3-amino-2-methylpropionate-pyruvate transaminase